MNLSSATKGKASILFSAIFLAAMLILFTSCGSTSELRTLSGAAVGATQKFARVTVRDFKLSTPEMGEKANGARAYFADRIAAELTKAHRFASVTRNGKAAGDTLVIDGVIRNYEEGSRQKRFWIGMGFGMALVEADVEFRDSKGVLFGTVKVDKHSWPLGGALAASQDPEDFMNGAAEKIAQEATKLAK